MTRKRAVKLLLPHLRGQKYTAEECIRKLTKSGFTNLEALWFCEASVDYIQFCKGLNLVHPNEQ